MTLYIGNQAVTPNIVDKNVKLDSKAIVSNGTYNASDENLDGYNSVTVEVPSSINNQDKTITENGSYTADSGYSGLGTVNVNVPTQEPVITALTVTSNGIYTPPSGTDGYNPVNVNVPTPTVNLQSKAVTITENGTTSVTPDSDYTGLSSVDVTTNVAGGSGGDVLGISSSDLFTDNNGTLELKTDGTFNCTATDLADRALYQSCRRKQIKSVSFPNLTTVSGIYSLNYTFSYCSNLTDVSFPNLTTVSGSSALEYCFYQCSNITKISFPNLTTVSGGSAFSNTFRSCENLTSASFPSLTTTITNSLGGLFAYCSRLRKVWLPSTLKSLPTFSYVSSAFYPSSNATCVIYTDATEKPDGWGTYWNYYDTITQLSVVWGATYEDFENA